MFSQLNIYTQKAASSVVSSMSGVKIQRQVTYKAKNAGWPRLLGT
jgi:hypothetical protein